MEALADIEVALRTLKEADQETAVPQHPIDRKYDAMHCALTELDRESGVFSVCLLISSSLHLTPFSSLTTLYAIHKVQHIPITR